MGFPNVDMFLVKAFISGFQKLQSDPEFAINDLFEDLEQDDRAQIITYLNRLNVTKDLRDRDEKKKYLYIFPDFPLLGCPIPQIAISLGQEDTAEKFLGDAIGDNPEPIMKGATQIGWTIEKGYLAAASWNVDVVCATKEEAIWLSRCCQRFICEALNDLAGIGVIEVNITLADMRMEAQQLMQPGEMFNRTLRVTAKVCNTWKKLLPVSFYAEGINTALT